MEHAMFYFAYGSDLNLKEMARLCPNSKPKIVARLHHYKLIFAGWSRKWRGPTASIKPVRDERVIGALYEISDKDLKLLDKYTGYPTISDRITVLVNSNGDEPIKAETYVLKDKQEAKPSDEYISFVRQGYKDWRIG